MNSSIETHLRRCIRTMRRLYIKVKVATGLPIATVQLNGFKMRVDLRCHYVGRLLYTHKTYEEELTAFLSNTLKPGMHVVDIGANIGYCSMLSANRVGATGRVVSFEPGPGNFKLLKKNAKLNGFNNIITVRAAAGACSGNAELHLCEDNHGDHRVGEAGLVGSRESVRVDTVSVDEVLEQRGLDGVDLVKIDVQGFECQVVKGLRKTLDNPRLKWVVAEVSPDLIEAAGDSPEAYLDAFRSRYFEAFRLAPDGELQPISFDDILSTISTFDVSPPDVAFLDIVFRRK